MDESPNRVAPRGPAPASTRGLEGNPYVSLLAFWLALRGRCPNCGQGPLFDGRRSIRIRPTCAVCAVRFERDDGGFLGPSSMAWAVSMTAEIVLFLVLYRAYGIFPGMEWVLILGGVLSIVLTWRALKGIWVWLLWVSGLVTTDAVSAADPFSKA